MNAFALKVLPVLAAISVLFPIISPLRAESTSQPEASETIERQLSLKRPNQEADVFTITGPTKQVQQAASTATILYVAGVDKESVNMSIEFILVGADVKSVANLMLALHGLLPKDQLVNITKFDQALESYNKIIDLANEETIGTLKNNVHFTDIGKLLKEMRQAIK